MAPTFGFLGLTVRDMPTTLAFYRRLGFDIPKEMDDEPHVDVELVPGVGLAFDTEGVISSFDPSFVPGSRAGDRTALAFRCASPAEVDARYDELTGAGYNGHLAPFDAFWGQRYATLHDPDGTTVDLYAQLPGTETST